VSATAPASQAGHRPNDILRPARRRLGGHVLVADEARHVVARAAALLDVGGDRPDRVVGEVARHPGQGVRLEDDVGVHHEQRLHPVVGEHGFEAEVERVRLALTALLTPQVEHPARVALGLLRDDNRSCVGTRIVDHVDAERIHGIVEQHQAVDRGADDRRLVPCREQDRGAREEGGAFVVMIVPVEQGDEDELVERHQQWHGSQHDERHEQPLAGQAEIGEHGSILQTRGSLRQGYAGCLPWVQSHSPPAEGMSERTVFAHEW